MNALLVCAAMTAAAPWPRPPVSIQPDVYVGTWDLVVAVPATPVRDDDARMREDAARMTVWFFRDGRYRVLSESGDVQTGYWELGAAGHTVGLFDEDLCTWSVFEFAIDLPSWRAKRFTGRSRLMDGKCRMDLRSAYPVEMTKRK